MSNATCSFFIYYYLYYSYINSIYYSYTIAKSSSNIRVFTPLSFGEGQGVRLFFYTLIFTVFSFLSSVATFIIYSPVATCFCHDVALIPNRSLEKVSCHFLMAVIRK